MKNLNICSVWGRVSRRFVVVASVLWLGAIVAAGPVYAAPFVYVTDFFGGNSVMVIDAATNAVVATITVGTLPAGVAVSPDGTRVYVSNAVDNTVSVIATATNSVIATIPVGVDPTPLAVSPDGTRVYVGDEVSNDVAVINTGTNTVLTFVPVGLQPVSIAVTPDGTRAFVSNINSSTVSVISTATNMLSSTFSLTTPASIAITKDGSRAYVVSESANQVLVVDTSSDAILAIVPVGNSPGGLALTPDGAHVYVTNSGDNTVSVIETTDNTVTTTVPAGLFPFSVAITPDGAHAYVTNLSVLTVTVIDTASNSVSANVLVNSPTFGVAITPQNTIPFKSMEAAAVLDERVGEFALQVSFTLGAGSPGIQPSTQNIQLQLGTFSVTIPAGSFKGPANGPFVFDGAENGTRLAVAIIRTGSDSYSVVAAGKNAILSGIVNPVTVGLAIGDNSGNTAIHALIVGAK